MIQQLIKQKMHMNAQYSSMFFKILLGPKSAKLSTSRSLSLSLSHTHTHTFTHTHTHTHTHRGYKKGHVTLKLCVNAEGQVI